MKVIGGEDLLFSKKQNGHKVQKLWAFKRERERERNFFFKKRTPTLVVSKWSDLISLK